MYILISIEFRKKKKFKHIFILHYNLSNFVYLRIVNAISYYILIYTASKLHLKKTHTQTFTFYTTYSRDIII